MATHREQVLKKLGLPMDTSLSVAELAKLTDIPKGLLDEVYRRGLGAHRSSLSSVRLKDFTKNSDTKTYTAASRLSAPQWAMARVYAYINKSPTYYGPDADLRIKYAK